MKRAAAALIVGFCMFVPQAVLAKAKTHGAVASALTRVEVAPGASVAIPRGWMACDKTLNAQIGSPIDLAKVPAFVCTSKSPGERETHFASVTNATPLSLLVDIHRVPFVTAAVMTSATPEMLAELDSYECRTAAETLHVDPKAITSCDFKITSVAQHVTLMGQMTVAPSGTAAPHIIRAFFISYGHGSLQLQFEMQADHLAKSEALMSSIANSVVVGPVDPSPPPGVEFTPAPGVSLLIPTGWMACDDADNVRLGSTWDRDNVRAKTCNESPAPADSRLRAFDPQVMQNVSVSVRYGTDKDIDEKFLKRLASEDAAEISAKECEASTKSMVAGGAVVESCAFALGQIGGRPALTSTMVVLPSKGTALDRYEMKSFYVPYSQGYVTLDFSTPVTGKVMAQPITDSAIASVTIP